MSRGGVAFVITIAIVVGFFWNHAKLKDDRQYNNQKATATVQRTSGRDQYGLLASDYDRNGWAQVNGKWVSNPRAGATVRYSIVQSNVTVQASTRTVSSTLNGQISQHTNIERTLRRVSENWKRIDVNKDGKHNCIDAAVLFYQYFPDKSKVKIVVNNNPRTGMHHLFNSVLTDGVWMVIEPQAYLNNYSNYSMRAVWGNKYDQSYNRDATSDYLRYVRN